MRGICLLATISVSVVEKFQNALPIWRTEVKDSDQSRFRGWVSTHKKKCKAKNSDRAIKFRGWEEDEALLNEHL